MKGKDKCPQTFYCQYESHATIQPNQEFHFPSASTDRALVFVRNYEWYNVHV